MITKKFPKWLHYNLPKGDELFDTTQLIKEHNINTVCEEAKCPNRSYCFANKTATFLALGKDCTRACPFCEIGFSKAPKEPTNEAENIAFVVKKLGLEHVVITMVARDDLSDGGASKITKIVDMVRQKNPHVTVELLTSDFQGNIESVKKILKIKPEIFNHNIETVRRLTPRVRHLATYNNTLGVLEESHRSKTFTKSGLMVGLGESEEEVEDTLKDLYKVGCDVVTIGQYLQPSKKKLRVINFVEPKTFEHYKHYGEQLGIKYVYSGPFVRSSFNAKKVLKELKKIGNHQSTTTP